MLLLHQSLSVAFLRSYLTTLTAETALLKIEDKLLLPREQKVLLIVVSAELFE